MSLIDVDQLLHNNTATPFLLHLHRWGYPLPPLFNNASAALDAAPRSTIGFTPAGRWRVMFFVSHGVAIQLCFVGTIDAASVGGAATVA
jgi:hypothetical protein